MIACKAADSRGIAPRRAAVVDYSTGAKPKNGQLFTEEDWNELSKTDGDAFGAYAYSKAGISSGASAEPPVTAGHWLHERASQQLAPPQNSAVSRVERWWA